MKPISSALQAHLAQELTTLATCWKLTRRDGEVLGFTDHDHDLTVEGVPYLAASGFTPTAMASSSALTVDNLDVEGMLSAEAITETDVMAGLYDHAEISVFQVNYADLSMGRLPLRTGWLGEVEMRGGRFVAEVRGLAQRLSQRIGAFYSPSCRAALGDSRCQVNLAPLTVSGSISGVVSRSVLRDSTRTEAADTFSFGMLTFTTGANAGLSMEIKLYAPGEFTLFLPFPYDVAPGDAYMAVHGCDKTFQTCIARFSNAVNFRGEPHVPGTDRLLETAATRSEWD